MKRIVLYRSKTGFVKKYANWISKALHAELKDVEDVEFSKMENYGLVIFGGGLYAGGINGLKYIKKNYHLIENKELIFFLTGASPGREEEINEVLKRNFTESQLQKIKFFYLRGGFDFDKLGFIDKLLMRVMKSYLNHKKEKTADDMGMLGAFEKPVNFAFEKNISELVEYVEKLETR